MNRLPMSERISFRKAQRNPRNILVGDIESLPLTLLYSERKQAIPDWHIRKSTLPVTYPKTERHLIGIPHD